MFNNFLPQLRPNKNCPWLIRETCAKSPGVDVPKRKQKSALWLRSVSKFKGKLPILIRIVAFNQKTRMDGSAEARSTRSGAILSKRFKIQTRRQAQGRTTIASTTFLGSLLITCHPSSLKLTYKALLWHTLLLYPSSAVKKRSTLQATTVAFFFQKV